MKFQHVLSNGSFSLSQTTSTPALTTLDATVNNQRYFPYFNTTTANQWEVGGTKNGQLITTASTNTTYDNYGNPTTIASTVTDNDTTSPYYNQQWTSTTVNTIAPQTSTWCLGLPTQTTVTNSVPGVPNIARTVGYTPDYTACRETFKIIEPASATYKVTEAYGFDSFGNVATDTVTGIGMASRVSNLSWGTTGQYLTTITKPLTPTVTRTYDAAGDLTSQTDPNSTSGNPIITSWAYNDGFFRKTLETRPDGTFTTYGYNICATAGCVNTNNKMTVTQTNLNVGGSTQSVLNTYLDSVDRTLVSSGTLLSGTYNRVETQYDSLGRVYQQSAPCLYASCTPYWTTNFYDVLNRLYQSQRPISATNSTLQTTTKTYAGRTATVTDPQGKATTTITQVSGSVGRTQDHNGYYVNFNYDAFGSLLSVTDSQSNTLRTMTYDYGLGGFARTLSDMDLGTRSSTYDALGEVVGATDGKGNSSAMIYDALARPYQRTEPEGTTTWVWGSSAASYNFNRLASVSSPGYSESNTYDSRARLASRSITTDASYAYGYTYNATTGLLDTLTYPTSTSGYSLKLQYTYAYGQLQQVKDANAGTVFWTANATNPRGQLTQETLGNGIIKNQVFDALTGWIGSIQAGVGGGAAIQNETYLFDLVGNVTQRQNNNAGLTENFYYDNLYRLDHSALGGTTNLQMNYDATGNITSRSDVAAGAVWTYDPARKHAVSQAGSTSNTNTYDANGNAATRNGYGIIWSSYNYPTVINGPSKTMSFSYDANRQRYSQVYKNGGTTETTQYVGGLLEKVTVGSLIDWRHYIRAGSELVAIMSRQSTGTNATHYLLEDHEGSIDKITDSLGALTIAESFSAFGTRRAITWSGPCPCPDATVIAGISREGFTGQDAIGGISMGLNHMNGRVEDAILGRFLSPDPQTPNPRNTQSWNRYSYVNNNPLSYTDPTGFEGKPSMTCIDNCNDSAPNAALDEIVVTSSNPDSGDTSNNDYGGTSNGESPNVAGTGTGSVNDGGGGSETPLAEVVVTATRPAKPTVPKPTIIQVMLPVVSVPVMPSIDTGEPTGCPKGGMAKLADSLVEGGQQAIEKSGKLAKIGGGLFVAGSIASAVPGGAVGGVPTAIVGAAEVEFAGMVAIGGVTAEAAGGAINAYYGNYQPLINAGQQAGAVAADNVLNAVFPNIDKVPIDSLFGKIADALHRKSSCP